MPEITVKGRVTSDRKLTADVPDSVPEGEVDVVVQIPEGGSDNDRLIEFLRKLQKQPGRPSRSKEDIDRQIEEERNSWER